MMLFHTVALAVLVTASAMPPQSPLSSPFGISPQHIMAIATADSGNDGSSNTGFDVLPCQTLNIDLVLRPDKKIKMCTLVRGSLLCDNMTIPLDQLPNNTAPCNDGVAVNPLVAFAINIMCPSGSVPVFVVRNNVTKEANDQCDLDVHVELACEDSNVKDTSTGCYSNAKGTTSCSAPKSGDLTSQDGTCGASTIHTGWFYLAASVILAILLLYSPL